MKKNIFPLIFTLFLANNLLCQTKLILLGSTHAESSNLTLPIYKEVLESIKPDVILFELDSTDMTETFEFKKVMLDFVAKLREQKIKQNFFEIDALVWYKKIHPEVIIRPYDIKNRDKYYYDNQYYQNQALFTETLEKG